MSAALVRQICCCIPTFIRIQGLLESGVSQAFFVYIGQLCFVLVRCTTIGNFSMMQ